MSDTHGLRPANTAYPPIRSLELQTATSEILELISAHPGDLDTVLNGILRKVSELCDAPTADVLLRHGDVVRFAAVFGGTVELSELGNMDIPVEQIDSALQARNDRVPFLIDDFKASARDKLGKHLAELNYVRKLRDDGAVPRRGVDRQPQPRPPRGSPVRREAGPDPPGLRRPGRDRGRQRAPVPAPRGADAHRRGG